jgi:hypothetical protein
LKSLENLKAGNGVQKEDFRRAKRGQSGKSHHAEAATDDKHELKILAKKQT